MLNNFIKTTLRTLWTNKGYSFLNIFGLAIGVACAALIFLWVESEITFDQVNRKKDRLYIVLENQAYDGKTYTFSSTPGLMGPAIKSEIPGVANACRITWNQSVLFQVGDKAIFQKGFYTDSSLLSMFTMPLVQGDPAHIFDQLHSLVISEKTAKRFFGNEARVVGKTIRVNNSQDYVVTGVVKDFPENTTVQFDWIAPFDIFLGQNNWLLDWGNNGIKTYVELLPSTQMASVDKVLYNFIQKRSKAAVPRPFLFAMKDWHLRFKFEEGKQTGGRIEFVQMFTIIAWIVLAIACINFMNLATARSEKRAREVGVRKVLGAAKSSLVRQFIGEAMIMSVLGVLLAIGLIALALPSFNSLVEKTLVLNLLSATHILALICITILCGLVAGSYPAFYLSGFNPIFVFKGLKMKGSSASVIRKGLVVFQFVISITLIISTIIIYQQVVHVKARDLGYSKDQLISLDVQGDMQKHFEPIKQGFYASGQVDHVALASLDMLGMGSNTSNFTWQGKDPNSKILITVDNVSPEYISTTQSKIVLGRDFRTIADSLNIIINETLAKLMRMDNPVGAIIQQDTTRYTVVGVVKDFVYGDMYGKPDPLIFFCYPPNGGVMYVHLKPQTSTQAALASVQAVLKTYNPGYPFDYRFVDDDFNELFKTESLIGKLSQVFAALAIVISCLGLFGLAAYTAERRTKEIGIRRVLGASGAAVVRLLSKDFLLLVAISAALAFPVAWFAMQKWLQSYAYRIQIQWWVFVLAGTLAMAIAWLTVSFQAIRAAAANPAGSLRTE
jgi:putative ABC transport system permease protein